MGAGEAPRQVHHRRLGGLGVGGREAERDGGAQGVAQAAGVLGGGHPLLAGHPDLDGSLGLHQLLDPAAHLGRRGFGPQLQLGPAQRPEGADQVVQLVGV
ncbi:hypothetical protein B7486_69585, partial [cyanobacterium TDX16]